MIIFHEKFVTSEITEIKTKETGIQSKVCASHFPETAVIGKLLCLDVSDDVLAFLFELTIGIPNSPRSLVNPPDELLLDFLAPVRAIPCLSTLAFSVRREPGPLKLAVGMPEANLPV